MKICSVSACYASGSGQVLVEFPIADNGTTAEVDVGQAGVYVVGCLSQHRLRHCGR